MRAQFAGVVAGALGGVLIAGAPVQAHHAIGSVVDTSKTLSAQMVLTKVDWINPHAWFHFTLTRADGTQVRDVAVEWQGLSGLRQRGYAGPEAFPVGRIYSVAYYPNRDGSPGGHLVSIDQGAAVAPVAAALPPIPQPRPKYSLSGEDQ